MAFIAGTVVKGAGKHAIKTLAKKTAKSAAKKAVSKKGKGQKPEGMSSKNKFLLIAGCLLIGLIILIINSFVGAIMSVGQFLHGGKSSGEWCEVPADWTGDPFSYTCPLSGGSNGVTNGAWGGYSNGLIPDSALASPSFNPSARFRPDAATAMTAMSAAFKLATGADIAITDSYRSLAGQYACTASKGNLCAPPGFSNHGWGLAADLGGGINNLISTQHAWMNANAGTYGWVHPAWAEPSGSKPEPWHWEYVGVVGSSNGSTPAGARSIAATLFAQYSWDTISAPGSGSEFTCLNNLWNKESGWNYLATNASSGAFGIPQALPGDKMSSVGTDWKTNPETQIVWGLNYIRDRYNTPCGAWAHSQLVGWY